MKVALVASSELPQPGPIESHVAQLAGGVASRGPQVELLLQTPLRRTPLVSEADGVVVRRFRLPVGRARVGVARELGEHLRRSAASFDVIDVHSGHLPLARAVARLHPERFVFAPHAPIQRLRRWPYASATRAVIQSATRIVCASQAQADLLRGEFPPAASRVCVVTRGVDIDAIQAAKPFPGVGNAVLSVGWLERGSRIDRAIAAMVGLARAFRLIIVGDGPLLRRLQAYARDLDLSSKIEFVGRVSATERYRWLRTARVVTALSECHAAGHQALEALAAGTPVVAADNPVHREAASYVAGAGITFVSPEGSPLEVADAISRVAASHIPPTVPLQIPTWDQTVQSSLALYDAVAAGREPPPDTRGYAVPARPEWLPDRPAEPVVRSSH
jgi:glycosyltransferase involved in cell wall biosynthesis